MSNNVAPPNFDYHLHPIFPRGESIKASILVGIGLSAIALALISFKAAGGAHLGIFQGLGTLGNTAWLIMGAGELLVAATLFYAVRSLNNYLQKREKMLKSLGINCAHILSVFKKLKEERVYVRGKALEGNPPKVTAWLPSEEQWECGGKTFQYFLQIKDEKWTVHLFEIKVRQAETLNSSRERLLCDRHLAKLDNQGYYFTPLIFHGDGTLALPPQPEKLANRESKHGEMIIN